MWELRMDSKFDISEKFGFESEINIQNAIFDPSNSTQYWYLPTIQCVCYYDTKNVDYFHIS